ncbi:MAG: family 20 glycosylhydrolase [Bacteroidales bacterium]|nr:family 20 glycosylhydrolase [Bacteroidales bacterium]
MKTRHLFISVALSLLFLSCTKTAQKPLIIPAPVSMEEPGGQVTINRGWSIVTQNHQALSFHANYLADRFLKASGIELPVTNEPGSSAIRLLLDEQLMDSLGIEGYTLIASGREISITAADPGGVFNGIQTLFQLLPPEIYSAEPVKTRWSLPSVRISDSPRFTYRGYMLDVSRHFFPLDHLYRVIDQLAYHKLNKFHLHLTNDQGWRIEIKKYPKLTEVGAWRVNRESDHWNSRELQQPGEVADYGGFYTQYDIRKLVQYASERNITIIPEIEMPAHATAALAAYPEYSCTGEPLTVLPGGIWPCSNIFCAGKEETFSFLEDILSEVIELFPSPYIHIGGDEADKTEWESCPDCQQRIKQENLNNEDELQSYFIRRIDQFLTSKGRKLIGWDEILEGGLAENATVMSWRGIEGGIEAARAGHPVIMTPNTHCYIDYYQGSPDLEPLAIGGYIPLEKIYSFEPVPEQLTEEESHLILGGQANLWTEYVADPDHADYMTYPRLAALAEVCWSLATNKDYEDFLTRLTQQIKRYNYLDINYSRSFGTVEVKTSYNTETQGFQVILSSGFPGAKIRYTSDGSNPTISSTEYTEPIVLGQSATIKAATFLNRKLFSPISSTEIVVHLATGKPVTYINGYSVKYPAGGNEALVNSLRGSINLSDGQWQGFEGNDMVAEIDLGSAIPVRKVTVGTLHSIGSWVFFPTAVEVWTAGQSREFVMQGRVENEKDIRSQQREIQDFIINFDPQSVRYLRIIASNTGFCPPWHAGAGFNAWLFVDEIIVE